MAAPRKDFAPTNAAGVGTKAILDYRESQSDRRQRGDARSIHPSVGEGVQQSKQCSSPKGQGMGQLTSVEWVLLASRARDQEKVRKKHRKNRRWSHLPGLGRVVSKVEITFGYLFSFDWAIDPYRKKGGSVSVPLHTNRQSQACIDVTTFSSCSSDFNVDAVDVNNSSWADICLTAVLPKSTRIHNVYPKIESIESNAM